MQNKQKRMDDQCPIPPGTGNIPPAHWYDTWDRSSSKSFSAKGLRNAPGENNCFMNSAVQVFWHLDVFRRSYRRLTGHLCMGNSCIFCGIKVIFTQFQYSDQSSLPPDTLRKALAETFANQQRFQLGHMDDAAECFENILRRIHFHIANNHNEDACTAGHCLPHAKFAMKVFDQLVCVCGSKSDPLTFHEMVHYISTNALVNQCRSMHETGDILHPDRFGLLLRNAAAVGDIRDCPGGCGKRVQIRRTLLNCPDVVSIGLVWNSDRPDAETVTAVARSIGTTILLQDVFHSVMCNDVTKLPKLQLAAMVCYYGKHYSTFVYHTKLNVWIYFDDATVREIGPRWEHVVDKCVQGHYQPLLLLYANPAGNPVSTDSAPKKRVMAPGYSTPTKGSVNKEQRTGDMTLDNKENKNGTRRSLTPNPDLHSNMEQTLKGRRAVTPGPDLQSPDEEKGKKLTVEHHRHNSFLIAVTGKNDKNKQNGNTGSHYQVPVTGSGRQPLIGGQGQVEGYQRMPSVPERIPVTNQKYQQENVGQQSRDDQAALDEYNYTLSNSDQYRRPSVGSPDQNKFPLTLNFSRAAEAQRKESFKKGKGKIGADVIRYSVDAKSSSDSDSPVFPESGKGTINSSIPPSLPPKQIRRSHSHNEESLANISADNIDIRQHIVIKPKSSSAHIYENVENLMHTPVQSGLATLPRNKKSQSSQPHSHIRQGSMHSENESFIHSRQNSDAFHSDTRGNGYITFNKNSRTQNSVPNSQIIHSNQSSTSTLTEDRPSRHSSVVSQTSQAIDMVQKQQQSCNVSKPQHSRQSSVVSESTQKQSAKEKPPKPAKPEKKSSLQKKKSNQLAQVPPPLPEKRKPVSPQSPDRDSYIDRKMVESVLSRQKLSRQGSSVSTSSQNSNNSFDSDNYTVKGSLSVEIPFDRLSLESQQPSDSGYGSSDRNSSSSTGSATLDPYTQYFLSKSMIPPKTFNQQAIAENMKKFLSTGTDKYSGFQNNTSYTVASQYGYQPDSIPQHLTTSSYGGKAQPPLVHAKEQGQRSEQQMDQSADKRQLYDPAIVKSHTQNKDPHMYHMTQKLPVHDSRIAAPARPNHLQEGFDQINPKVGAPAHPNPNTHNEVAPPSENNQFMMLCKKAEDLMDQCMLAETEADCSRAINYCNAAADCFKQAMKLPNLSQQSFTFAQRSHNSCILKFRSLQKKFIMRQESTSSSDSARSSPLPSSANQSLSHSSNINHHSEQKFTNQGYPLHSDTVHSRSSSKDSIDSVIENKNYRKDRTSLNSEHKNNSSSELNKLTSGNNSENRSHVNSEHCNSGNKLATSRSNQNLNERTLLSGSENIDIYATLPRKPKKINKGQSNSQVTDVSKDYANRQNCTIDSYQHGRTPSTGSSTPTPMDNRESDFNQYESNECVQFQYDVSAQQPVKMNKAEIRQLLHNNMVQRQNPPFKGQDANKNWSSSSSNNQHYIEVCTSTTPQLTAKACPVPPARLGRANPPPVPAKGDIGQNKAKKSNLGNTQSAFQNVSTFSKQGGITRHASFHSGIQSQVGCFQSGKTLDRHASLPDCQHPVYTSVQANKPVADHSNSNGSNQQTTRVLTSTKNQPEVWNQSSENRIPSRPLTPQQLSSESNLSSSNGDFRPSVRALASKFEHVPQGNSARDSVDQIQVPPNGGGSGGLGNRHRSKSESDFRAMEMKPKSVLSKKKKNQNRKSTKSVTFSDSIALIAATDAFLNGNANPSDNTHLGYLSDDEEKYYQFRGSHSDNECDDDDSSTSAESPTEPTGEDTCTLCNKKGVVEGLIYCSKCQVYMSRFRPEYC